MAAKSEKPFWFENDVKSINPDAQKLLEEYSGLKPDEVLPHVLKLVCPLSFVALIMTDPTTSGKRLSRSVLILA